MIFRWDFPPHEPGIPRDDRSPEQCIPLAKPRQETKKPEGTAQARETPVARYLQEILEADRLGNAGDEKPEKASAAALLAKHRLACAARLEEEEQQQPPTMTLPVPATVIIGHVFRFPWPVMIVRP